MKKKSCTENECNHPYKTFDQLSKKEQKEVTNLIVNACHIIAQKMVYEQPNKRSKRQSSTNV